MTSYCRKKERKKREKKKETTKANVPIAQNTQFINQLILFSLNTLSTIYIKTLTCTSSILYRIPTSIRPTNKT